MIGLEIIIVLLLVVFNGFLAMSELAIISSRRARLERLATDGSAGARAALTLADDPGRLLAALQVGLTSIAVLAGRALQTALIIPERTSILRTIALFRKTPVNTAVIVDEYGAVQGHTPRGWFTPHRRHDSHLRRR